MSKPRGQRVRRAKRAQSETLGLVLVLGLVLFGAVLVVSMGAVAISGVEDGLANDRAEKTMTQFASRSALVALEGADRQQIDLPGSNRDSYTIDEDAGWMNVTYHREDEPTETVRNFTLGKMTYNGNDGTTIAYQGGGVWRSSSGGGSTMVSPPEFHYRGTTLTLPVVTVSGDSQLGSGATIDREGTTGIFPDDTDLFTNPLEDGQVNVTVHSKYYRAWGNYFGERTDGGVSYDHDANEVTAELVVPINEQFDNVVASTSSDGITANPGPKPDPFEEGIAYPSPDPRIEDKVEECKTDGCDSIPSDDTIDSGGTYFHDGYYEGEINVDNPDDDVEIVINGSYDSEGMDIDTDDETSVSVYIRGSFSLSGSDQINADGDAGTLRTLVHSDDPLVDFNGNVKYVGLLYAPENHCNFNGGPEEDNFEGGLICDTVDINGEPNDFSYDESVEDIDLDLGPEDVNFLTFLHISEHQVDITSN